MLKNTIKFYQQWVISNNLMEIDKTSTIHKVHSVSDGFAITSSLYSSVDFAHNNFLRSVAQVVKIVHDQKIVSYYL